MLATGKSFRARRESRIDSRRCDARRRSPAKRAFRPVTILLHASIVRSGSGARKAFDVNGSPGRVRRFSRQGAGRHVRARRLAPRRGRPGRCGARFSTARSRSSHRSTIATWRGTARSSSKRRRCCAGRSRPTATLLLAYNDELLDPGAALMEARASFVAEIALAARGRLRTLERHPRTRRDRIRAERRLRRCGAARGAGGGARGKRRGGTAPQDDAGRPAPRRRPPDDRRQGARCIRFARPAADGGTCAQGCRIRNDARAGR